MSAPTIGGLPTAPQLLSAFQGRRMSEHEPFRSAHALAGLHERRLELGDPGEIAELDARRAALVELIDEWIAREAPEHRDGAALHTETLGAVVDRMARSWVAANRAIDSEGARSDKTHKHWYHLAELVDGYTDLVTDVAGGRRRLPGQ
ncbi:DUF4254 domain-containing protein [Nocardia asteroides]|uniref:DUF4254 domain-containing protein n=1 Tax=Nocardia asteroides TaxID=1824 RepID=UPI001E5CEB4F|nr:DUF4254 domain-containing protein [Nocardia asteroides]UGT63671.1 DUF4254 domain-containing protein [Nocardia asteroides]